MINRKSKNFKKNITISTISLAMIFLILGLTTISGSSSNNYYVSLLGDDSNSGDINNPLATLQHAADISTHGDVIIVSEGDYTNQGRIYLRNSGEENNLIVFEAEGVVKTKGFGIFGANGGTVDYVKIKGFDISNTDDDVINGPGIIVHGKGVVIENNNIHDCSKEGIWLFIQYDGNTNPDLSATSECSISNNTIKNSGGDGVRILGNNNTIKENKIFGNSGIGISSLNANFHKIYNNIIYENNWQGIHLAHSEGSIIDGNKIYGNCKEYDDCFGIDIIGIGDDNKIRYNEVYSQYDTILDNSISFRYGGNTKYGTGGIRFDGDYNGDLVTSTNSNGNMIHNNVIYDEYQGIQIINFGNSEIYNNNILDSGLYGILLMAQPSGGITKNTVVKNNIIRDSKEYLVCVFGGEESAFDHNIYFDDSENSFNFNGDIGDINFLKSSLAGDSNSMFTDPMLNGNFLLEKESPAIDSGVYVGLVRDFLGISISKSDKIDIGAIESKYKIVSNCGNGKINDDEECDSNNLDGESCVTLGYDKGNLKCSSLCKIDDSFCENKPICKDSDKDGFNDILCGGNDCNDKSFDINPSINEVCDGIDNNCNGNIDEDSKLSCSKFGSKYYCSSGKCCVIKGRWFWKRKVCRTL